MNSFFYLFEFKETLTIKVRINFINFLLFAFFPQKTKSKEIKNLWLNPKVPHAYACAHMHVQLCVHMCAHERLAVSILCVFYACLFVFVRIPMYVCISIRACPRTLCVRMDMHAHAQMRTKYTRKY